MSGRCRKTPPPKVYGVKSIRRCTPPEGATGRWWRIVVTSVNGASCEWMTPGTREEVSQRAAAKVKRLNDLAGDVLVADVSLLFARDKGQRAAAKSRRARRAAG